MTFFSISGCAVDGWPVFGAEAAVVSGSGGLGQWEEGRHSS